MKLKEMGTLLLMVGILSLASFGHAEEVRKEINLASKDWQMGIADTLDLKKVPDGLKWKTAKVPTGYLGRELKSAGHMWAYGVVPPEKYFDKNGKFKVKEKLSAWFKRSIKIPKAYLENHAVILHMAGASFRSGVIVNGKFVGDSIHPTVPLDFDITKFVKSGKNEITIAVTPREGLLDPKHQVYLAPSMGPGPSIRGPIRLEFIPLVATEDVFVKTSVKNKNIDFQITIVNRGGKDKTVTPLIKVRSARDPKQVVGQFNGKPVTVSPSKESVINIKENWVAPILWSLTTPEIYIADVSLMANDKLVDNYKQTFGFREFTAKGKDFLLNGKRIVLLRNSSLNGLKTLENKPDEISITQKPGSVNCIRQHLGCCNMDLIHRGNQQGILVVPESAYSWVNRYPHTPEKTKYWLPGLLEYYKLWARQMRNEPSVVIYSLTNETYWERNLPEEMAVAKQIVDVVRKEDPTRLLQGDGDNDWNGLLDIINIHYPEGTAGTLRLKYPNSNIMVPNDIQWLKEGKKQILESKIQLGSPLGPW